MGGYSAWSEPFNRQYQMQLYSASSVVRLSQTSLRAYPLSCLDGRFRGSGLYRSAALPPWQSKYSRTGSMASEKVLEILNAARSIPRRRAVAASLRRRSTANANWERSQRRHIRAIGVFLLLLGMICVAPGCGDVDHAVRRRLQEVRRELEEM